MVNIDLHKSNLVNILREIYSDPELRTNLGFKGGTCAMLFYGLPRFSVDLDFDLIDPDKKEEVFQKLKKILPQFGNLAQAQEKKYTLFFLISYKTGERGLKVEISKRSLLSEYAPKNYLGISMLVMKEEDMVAGKLAALLTRRKFASRDLFDLWFFLKNNWQIDEKVVKGQTNLSLAQALQKAQDQVKALKRGELLAGLGELLDTPKYLLLDKLSRKQYIVFNMQQLTVGQFKAKLSQVLEKILQGESIGITYGKNKKKVAALVPYSKFMKQPKFTLGLLEGDASFKIHDDFKMNDEEFLRS